MRECLRHLRWTFLAALTLCAGNYLATHAAIAAFGLGNIATLVVSSWNALATLILFVGYLTLTGMPPVGAAHQPAESFSGPQRPPAKSAFSSLYVAGASKSAS